MLVWARKAFRYFHLPLTRFLTNLPKEKISTLFTGLKVGPYWAKTVSSALRMAY